MGEESRQSAKHGQPKKGSVIVTGTDCDRPLVSIELHVKIKALIHNVTIGEGAFSWIYVHSLCSQSGLGDRQLVTQTSE